MRFLIGLLVGAVFGLGLIVSRMTDPARILGFLDVSGSWDPSLLFVMVGAIGVHAPFVFWLRRRGKALFSSRLSIPGEARVDARLILGAAVFGLGWGLSGYCPGPAIVAAARSGSAAILVLSMVVGMRTHDWLAERLARNFRGMKGPRIALPQEVHE